MRLRSCSLLLLSLSFLASCAVSPENKGKESSGCPLEFMGAKGQYFFNEESLKIVVSNGNSAKFLFNNAYKLEDIDGDAMSGLVLREDGDSLFLDRTKPMSGEIFKSVEIPTEGCLVYQEGTTRSPNVLALNELDALLLLVDDENLKFSPPVR